MSVSSLVSPLVTTYPNTPTPQKPQLHHEQQQQYITALSAIEFLLPVPTLRSQLAATPNNTPTRHMQRRALEETSINLPAPGSPYTARALASQRDAQEPLGPGCFLDFGQTHTQNPIVEPQQQQQHTPSPTHESRYSHYANHNDNIFDEHIARSSTPSHGGLSLQKRKAVKLEIRKRERAAQPNSRRSSGCSSVSSASSSAASSAGGVGSRKASTSSLSSIMPYQQYRQKQRKDGDSIWDDEVEEAFMEALRKIPKIGRQKLSIDGQPRGRNELIADYIFKVTGKHRGRKQVSSHIQVLKGHLKESKEFMSLFSSDEKTNANTWDADSSEDLDMASPDTTLSEPPYTVSMNMTTPPLPRASTHVPSSNHHALLSGLHSPPHHSHVNLHPIHHNQHPHSDYNRQPSAVQLRTFKMWVGTQSPTTNLISGCHHTYTSLAQPSIELAPLALNTIPEWQTRFPYLNEIRIEQETTVLHAYASIATLDSSPPSPSLLCTQLEVTLAGIAGRGSGSGEQGYECTTRIYAPGKMVWELAHNCPVASSSSTSASSASLSPSHSASHTSTAHSADDDETTLILPFASDFWSAFYTALSASQNSEKADREAIKGLTVVQEIICVDTAERVALLLWEFTKAEKGRSGKCVWRSVFIERQEAGEDEGFGDDGLGGVFEDGSAWGFDAHVQQPQSIHELSPVQGGHGLELSLSPQQQQHQHSLSLSPQHQDLLSPIDCLTPYYNSASIVTNTVFEEAFGSNAGLHEAYYGHPQHQSGQQPQQDIETQEEEQFGAALKFEAEDDASGLLGAVWASGAGLDTTSAGGDEVVDDSGFCENLGVDVHVPNPQGIHERHLSGDSHEYVGDGAGY